MFWRKLTKVKVRIHECAFGYCAEFYSDDAKKVLKVMDKCEKKILKALPFIRHIDIEIHALGYPLYRSDLRNGIVGYTDSEELKAKDLNDFISIIKSILERRKIKYDLVVE